MKRRILAFILATMVLLIAMPAFADDSYDATSIYKTYKFGQYTVGGSMLKVRCYSISYTSNTNAKYYHYARPYSTDGSLLGYKTKIVQTNSSNYTTISVNSDWTIGDNYKLKVYNAYFDESGNTDDTHKMVVHGYIKYS